MKFILPLASAAFAFATFICPGGSVLFAQSISQPGIALVAKNWNDIAVQNGDGKTLLTLTGFNVKPNPRAVTDGGTVRGLTTADGQPALAVDYQLRGTDLPAGISLSGLFVLRPGQVDVTYTLSGLPEGARVGESMFGRRLAGGAVELPSEKIGLWKRHAHGGIPQEHPDAKIVRYQVGGEIVALAFDAENRVNLSWKDGHAHHIGMSRSEAAEGTFTASYSVLLGDAQLPAEVLSARWQQRPVAATVGTQQLYNWWESLPGEPASAQPELELDATFANTSGKARTVSVKHWVRDFAGNFVARGSRDVELQAGEVLSEQITFRPSEDSADPSRDIFFAEVSIVDKETQEEAFARTNLMLLPPHEFKATSDDSIFGIAAYWPFPDEASVQKLMDRMGVRWYRQGNTHDYKNITAIRHNQIPRTRYEDDPKAGDEWIRKQLELCVEHGNPAWEFGNEINYAVMSIGMGDTVKDKEREVRIERYLGWVKAIRRMQQQMGSPYADVKLLSVGLAGMDVVFTDAIHAQGGWELLDGLALHPGRGNFTPDYPVSEPWQNWQGGAYGNYWNFYGAVRTAANLVKKYGKPGEPKELWLTEVYACVFPNSFWEDSLRRSAENALLTFALAQSEGVKSLMWYQMFDSVWHDKLGVNPKDREYYFGMINRDLSAKPALLAFTAAAEHLDQAEFVRWLQFPQEQKTRGLLFETPRGPMAVLWDRTDGYVLSERAPDFASEEPWVDEWRSFIPTRLPAAGSAVTVVNPIGQRQTLPAENGTVTVPLSGGAVVVYGLDVSKLD